MPDTPARGGIDALRERGRVGPLRDKAKDAMGDGTEGRHVLPIPDQPHVGLITYDAKDPDTSFPPIETLRPPAGAPNVLIDLIDCGFGASSAFAGPVNTPTAERLAANGLRYNPFPHYGPRLESRSDGRGRGS